MEKSGQIINLAKAIIKFKTSCPKIPKKSKNPFFRSMYAALPDIQDIIDPVLNTVGLTYTQHPEPGDKLTTVLIHADSGEFMQSTIDINPLYDYKEEKDENKKVIWRSDKPYVTPQTMGSAITYAKRYALVAILGLNVDDDDDGNAGSGKTTEGQPETTTEQPNNKKITADPNRPYLNPETQNWFDTKIWLFNKKDATIEKANFNYRITTANQAKLQKTEILKPGNKYWVFATIYLNKFPTDAGKTAITKAFEITDEDYLDLIIDATNYTPPTAEDKK